MKKKSIKISVSLILDLMIMWKILVYDHYIYRLCMNYRRIFLHFFTNTIFIYFISRKIIDWFVAKEKKMTRLCLFKFVNLNEPKKQLAFCPNEILSFSSSSSLLKDIMIHKMKWQNEKFFFHTSCQKILHETNKQTEKKQLPRQINFELACEKLFSFSRRLSSVCILSHKKKS